MVKLIFALCFTLVSTKDHENEKTFCSKRRDISLNNTVQCLSGIISTHGSMFAYKRGSCRPSLTLIKVNGEWDSEQIVSTKPAGSSTKQVCQNPPPIGNGRLVSTSGRNVGATAVYKCNAEFSTCGRSTTSTCMANRKWSDNVFCTVAKKHYKSRTPIIITRPCDWGYRSSFTVIATVKSGFVKFKLDIEDKAHNILMRSSFRCNVKTLDILGKSKKKEKPKKLLLVSELLARKKFNYTLRLTRNAYRVFLNGKERYRFKHRRKVLPTFFNFHGNWQLKSATFHL